MSNKKQTIYDYILLMADKKLVSNVFIYALFDKYLNDPREIEDIVEDINKLFFNISNYDEHDFEDYQITTPEELFKFIKDNFEYGLIIDNKKYFSNKLNSKENNIIRLDNNNLVNEYETLYNEMPDSIKNSFLCDSLKDRISLVANKMLYTKWKLNDYKTTLKNMIGTFEELIELECSFFKKLGLNHQRYVFRDLKDPSNYHLFTAFEQDDKWYYFEPINPILNGIHEFDSKKELETKVFSWLLQLTVISFDEEVISQKDYTKDQKNSLVSLKTYQEKYNYELELALKYLNSEEDYEVGLELLKSSINNYEAYMVIAKSLPKTYELYELRRVKKPKIGMSYKEYYNFMSYQTLLKPNNQVIKDAIKIYQNNKVMYRLIFNKVIVAGKLFKKDNIVLFEPFELPVSLELVDGKIKKAQFTKYLNQEITTLAFAQNHSNKAIYQVCENGVIEILGVPTYTNLSRNKAPTYLIGGRKDPFVLQQIDETLYFQGSEYYEEISQKEYFSNLFSSYEIATPNIIKIHKFTKEQIDFYKLPRTKERLKDYFKRVGVYTKIKTDVIENYNDKYLNGLEFGQVALSLKSPFFFNDLEEVIKTENDVKLKELLQATYLLLEDCPNVQSYLIYMAETLAKNMANLHNLRYYADSTITGYDLTLAGELYNNKYKNYDSEVDEYYNEILTLERRRMKAELREEKVHNIEGIINDLKFKYNYSFYNVVKYLNKLILANKKITGRNIYSPIMTVFFGTYILTLNEEEKIELKKLFEDSIDSNIYLTYKRVYKEDIDNQLIYDANFILKDLLKEKDNIIKERVNVIINDQKFLNKILKLSQGERFYAYLEKSYETNQWNLESENLYNVICDNSKMGLLIKKDENMLNTLKVTCSLGILNIKEFLEFNKRIYDNTENQDENEKSEIKTMISYYLKEKEERNLKEAEKKNSINEKGKGNHQIFILLLLMIIVFIIVGVIYINNR